MIAEGPHREAANELAVGDPTRSDIRLAVFATLALAALFFAFVAPLKQVKAVYDHAPWLNDPFDTVISFMMFFVPVIAFSCVPRVSLCRRSEPLAVTRVRDLLRSCRVMPGAVTLTLASEWVSVAIGANRSQWNETTWLQIGLLGLLT